MLLKKELAISRFLLELKIFLLADELRVNPDIRFEYATCGSGNF